MKKASKRLLAVLLATVMVCCLAPLGTLFASAQDAGDIEPGFIVAVQSVATVPPGYTGIYTPTDLNNARNNLSGKYILMNDIDLVGWGNWNPIGPTNPSCFRGIFDGNGYAVKNMTVSKGSDSGAQWVGLFGFVYNAEIKNLGVVNGNVYLEWPGTSSGRAGGIMGNAHSTDITNCYFTGNVQAIATSTSNDSFAGGIMGGGAVSRVDNCYNIGTVTSTATDRAHAGGIAGGQLSFVYFNNCYNAGTVSAFRDSTYLNSYSAAGGITGDCGANEKVDNCYNAGKISTRGSSSEGNNYEGGIVGYSTTTPINNCYYLSGTAEKSVGTGGVLTNVLVLSDSQMRQQSSFVGFDFETIWSMPTEGNYRYPVLKDIPAVYVPSTTYTVTLNPNGGSVNPASITVTNGGTYSALPIPTRANHTFDGWYTAASGGLKVNPNDTVNLTGNTTLFAHWTADSQPTPKKYIFCTKYEATFWNWILFFLGFGWIWMWF